MKNKYFNDAIVGNRVLTASFSKTGELLRLFYPTVDYKQFFEEFNVGIKINNRKFIYLNNEQSNNMATLYSQDYVANTNIVQTNIKITNMGLDVKQVNFVPIDKNLLVFEMEFKNVGELDRKIELFINPKTFANVNNDYCGYIKNNCLIQYSHTYSVCTFSNEEIIASQLKEVDSDFEKGIVGDNSYIGMSKSSAIKYDLGVLKPGKTRKFNFFIHVNRNEDTDLLTVLEEKIDEFRNIDVAEEYKLVKEYWQNYCIKHDKMNINSMKIDSNIKKIYNRSILMFSLLTNPVTGGISAGIEVDEKKTNCGRYSYCWPRDAVFITKAFDILNMQEESDKFYKVFCEITQSNNGMWEQRFFTDGNLAPNWGYQIDETASVIYGVYHHYKRIKDVGFIKDRLDMCQRAINYLEIYCEDMFNQRKLQKSFDLWEEYEGYSCYSIACIYTAYHSMRKMYEILYKEEIDDSKKADILGLINRIENREFELKEFITKEFYNKEKNSFVRNTDDNKMDISLLGLVYPCGVLKTSDESMQNTIEQINKILKTKSGGYLRYEADKYIGGKNSWPVATLWMSIYYLILGDKEKSLECFNHVIKTACITGLLGEQISESNLEPCWVIGLTWSHAMFIVALEKLLGNNWL